MKSASVSLVACIAVFCLAVSGQADVRAVKLVSPLTDNMVLQRDVDVPIWGTAPPKERITVSFNEQNKQTTSDETGKWNVVLSPMKAGGPHKMIVEGKASKVTLENVLIGEVWICTGQSNMDFPLGAFRAKYDAQVEAADMTDVRLVNFDTKGSGTVWRECTPTTASTFSATGFFFGRELYRKLGVPIGLIEGALGGTQLETWMSPAAAEECPGLKWGQLYKWKVVGENYPQIKAMMPYAIRGAIWYQGEMNGTANTGHTYAHHFAAMIKHWRKDWGLGDFPVLYVQLPNYLKPQTDNPKDDSQRAWPALREAQRMCLNLKNTGMAVTIDIGMADNIHPVNKLDVGKRLALNARALVYGEKDLVYSGPIYRDMAIEGNRIRLNFDHVGSGLVSTTGEKLRGFGITGDDMRFVWADAVIDGGSVLVSSPQVPNPKHAVYAWAINPIISLFNREGLPASPFKTWIDPPPDKVAVQQPEAPTMNIWIAALQGNADAVRQSIAAGADVNGKAEKGNSPLFLAALRGHTEAAKVLLDHDADPSIKNDRGDTPLHMAAFYAHPDFVALLIDRRADIDVKNNQGKTPSDNVAGPWSARLERMYLQFATAAGMKLDLERIKVARLKVAELLRTQDTAPAKKESSPTTAEGRTSRSPSATAWEQSYKAGYVDAQGRYAGGSEILHLEGHKGKLYAANSYWMDPSNIWYGGKDPKTAWSQILRLDRPNGKWEVDLELGPNNLRAENLKSVTFGTDGAGNRLKQPVNLLIAAAYSPNPQGADINVFVRDEDAGAWEKTVLISGTGESGENNSTRCMTVYRDRVTGVDRLFLPVGLLGIFTGVYDADVPGRILWDKTPETGRLDKRSLAIIEANDSLVYSSGTKIYRRNDGTSPTHSMVFDASQLSKGPVASPVGGVRGLSVIPNPEGPGESLLFVWAPDSRSRSCVVRLDQGENGKYSHTKEECVADLMSEYLSGNPVYYTLAGYNQILPILNPTTREPAYLMGFECWVGGRQFSCWQGNERGGFYAGAMYAIRDKNAQYWLSEVNGPTTVDKSPLQSVRTYEVSPFESEDGKVIYFGGFVADHGPSHNTAWVYKTSIENALRKDAPRPVRLTPEQSKAQLAALRQPYRFEYRDKPAFTIQIPGEFARGNATGGNVFHAKKAFNTLSISIGQSGDPEQAAKRYVEALKRVGNGKAELVRQSKTKLPDGTPAMEFLVKWVTKQNAVQTTQALTACDDGHSVTVATHTWEVGLPDKRFFFTLKFE